MRDLHNNRVFWFEVVFVRLKANAPIILSSDFEDVIGRLNTGLSHHVIDGEGELFGQWLPVRVVASGLSNALPLKPQLPAMHPD